MKKLSFRQRHPLYSKPILGIILAYVAPMLIINMLSLPFSVFESIWGEFGKTLSLLVASVSALVALLIHRRWFREEYSGCFNTAGLMDRKLNLIIIAAFFIVTLITVVPTWVTYGVAIPSAYMTAAAISAGICEETVFRVFPVSVMMRGKKDRKHVLLTLILTSVLFGVIHVMNLKNGASVSGTILQVFSASCSGLLLCTFFLRTGSILPGMIYHALYDYACFMAKNLSAGIVGEITFYDVVFECIAIVVEIVIVVLLMRGNMDKILETWRKIWKLPEVDLSNNDSEAENK